MSTKPIEGVLVLEGAGGGPVKEYRGFLFGAPVTAATVRASFEKKKKDCGYSLSATHERLRMIADDLSFATNDLKAARLTAGYRAK